MTKAGFNVARTDRSNIVLTGPIGDAMSASLQGRLRRFIQDHESEPIALFDQERAERTDTGDWYGEHAGKWLVTACLAVERTCDKELTEQIVCVADYLCSQQRKSGYLGTYSEESKGHMRNPEAVVSRTWDVWVSTLTILGLISAYRLTKNEKYLQAARRAYAFVVDSPFFRSGNLLKLGNHQGLSSAIFLDAAIELYSATNEECYLQDSNLILEGLNGDEELQLLPKLEGDTDVSAIGTGKIYQICWLLAAITKYCRAVGDMRTLRAVQKKWDCIRTHHLTLSGGPWGGIATHKEVFNPPDYFSPTGMVETCSAMAWLSFNIELYRCEPHAKYAEEVERTLYNSILGAADPNGTDWIYFSFPNGRRNNTYWWACCKSSGALALELGASFAVAVCDAEIRINAWIPFVSDICSLALSSNFKVATVKFASDYDGRLHMRIPSWSRKMELESYKEAHSDPNGYLSIEGAWRSGDVIKIQFDCDPIVVRKSHTIIHHEQEISRADFFAMTYGPLVYACDTIDGYKEIDTFCLPALNPESYFQSVTTPENFNGPAFDLCAPGRVPVTFLPYFEAGGRHHGAWRTTWNLVAWQ